MKNRKKANKITALIMSTIVGVLVILFLFPVHFMAALLGIAAIVGLVGAAKGIRSVIEDNLDDKDMEMKHGPKQPKDEYIGKKW